MYFIALLSATFTGLLRLSFPSYLILPQKLKFSRAVRALHFSRKSKLLALGGDDGVAYIVSIEDWRVVKEVRISSAIHTLGFSRSDESLAIGSSDGLLTILGQKGDWNVIGEMDESAAGVQTIDWSKGHLAVGRSDGSVTIHEAEKVHSNFFVPQAEFSRGSKPVTSVAFSVKGKYLGKFLGFIVSLHNTLFLSPYPPRQMAFSRTSCWWFGQEDINLQCKGWMGALPSDQGDEQDFESEVEFNWPILGILRRGQ